MGHEAEFIVVGAGSAGCVLAARLAAAGATVLLLEAGPLPSAAAIADPARMHELWHSAVDWDYLTVPQESAYDRRLHLPRGHVAGGSHALNGMIWTRGNAVDYDLWAYLGCAGWGWDQVRPLFERAERRIGVLRDYEPDPVHQAFATAATEAGLPFNPDYNGGVQDGVSFLQFTIRDGHRRTTFDAYLSPLPHGVTLVTGALVDRLIVRGARCTGVSYQRDGAVGRAMAGRAVVVCAGAIGSPALLLQSGIGPAAELAALGIPVVADLPGVGSNLQDHWLVPVIAATALPPGPPKGLPATQSHLFWRSDDGHVVPDLQPLHFGVPLYAPWMEGPPDGVTIMAGLDRPASRGRVYLSASGVCIDPRVLSRQADVTGLAAGVRLCQDILRAPALRSGWGARELYPASLATTEDGLDAYIRETVLTYHHQSGTCRMGVDAAAVVDPSLRVYGIAGLLVADASIMPAVTTGNTNAPAVMIAERAADLICLGGAPNVGIDAHD